MANLSSAQVTSVHHWNDGLFSFKTTRDPGFRFKNGQFVMIGLEVNARPLLRAYSVASPNYADELEFFSIKVPDGALTSRLQNIQIGDDVIIGGKATGSLIADDLLPGKNLFLLSTGTGLAAFMSVIQDPEVYDRFDRVILVHGTRHIADLAYKDFIENELPNNEFFGEEIKEKLTYYPTVTRETFKHQGRVTELMRSDKLTQDLGLPPMNPETDRVMICGNQSMLAECRMILDDRGFKISPKIGEAGDYVIERAFVEQ
ncbi:ferredoxin--NADP reductase [Marinomonas sp. 15G1-11]|uniref:ferredoxin--NADP(+) reductase n=1 Tax=Marinomonas phaeophyticola TaxID=3004091 RepID=A0ABT4JZ27_9GAMM|nr:ferredoxin--NADP reductase [Marinomonas sp. 15G1-11]MCZ2723480.1 ferredoxin--NADP reductase [Marinomonas sp. 15G1-11]